MNAIACIALVIYIFHWSLAYISRISIMFCARPRLRAHIFLPASAKLLCPWKPSEQRKEKNIYSLLRPGEDFFFFEWGREAGCNFIDNSALAFEVFSTSEENIDV